MEKRVTIHHRLGLHLRPAGELCTLAMEYDAKITLCFRDREFNAKSLLSVLSACVRQDDEVVLRFEGTDAEEAAERICAYLMSL